MAVVKHGIPIHRYIGAFSDTKPTKTTHDTPQGSTFYEYDTGIMYLTYDGTNWKIKDTKVGHDITGISSGRKTVTTPRTELALVASATPCKMVIITSETNNTGKIAIGASGATDATAGTESGTILYVGERFVFYIDDAHDLFVDAEVAGDGVAYTILT